MRVNPRTYEAMAERAGMAIREALRLNARNIVQHHHEKPTKQSQRLVDFLCRPGRVLVEEIATYFTDHPSLSSGIPEDPAECQKIAQDLIVHITKEHLLSSNGSPLEDGHLGLPIDEYKGFTFEKLLTKTLFDRVSNMPDRIVSVVGSLRQPTSEEADQAYTLGKRFAETGIIVLALENSGIMYPLLKGLRDHGGMSVGILRDTQIRMYRSHIDDESELITLPFVTPFQRFTGGESIERAAIAAASGRTTVVLNGREDVNSYRCVMTAAYFGVPVILYNTPLIHASKHALQTSCPLDEVFNSVERHLCLTDEIDENYSYFNGDRARTPISVLAGTSYPKQPSRVHVSREFVQEFSRRLSENDCFSITGGGPGPMADVSLSAHDRALTTAFNFFRTYLASNGGVDIPIVSGKKTERSDLMTLSSVLTVNLGGSHATFDELLSVRGYDKDIVNCAPGFESDFLAGFHGHRGASKIWDVESPSEAIAKIMRQIHGV